MAGEKSVLTVALSNISIVDRVFETIISAIMDGELKPGDQLPTEFSLCQNLNVGRNSVREAIKKLEAYGIVHIRRSEGTFVNEGYSQRMLDPMLYGIILQGSRWDEFIDLRRIIEIGTLYLVLRRTDTDILIQELNVIVDSMEEKMKAENPSVEEIMEDDTKFHIAIAKVLQNGMIKNITYYIIRITTPSRKKTIEMVLKDREEENFIVLHRKIVTVIKNKEFDKIEEAILAHYVYWEKEEQAGKDKNKQRD